MSRVTEGAQATRSCLDLTRRRCQASFRRVLCCTTGDWASSNPALAISRGPRSAPPLMPVAAATFLTCCFPLQLSLLGKPGGPETSFRIPPGCTGDTTRRLTAHSRSRSPADRVVSAISPTQPGPLARPTASARSAPTGRRTGRYDTAVEGCSSVGFTRPGPTMVGPRVFSQPPRLCQNSTKWDEMPSYHARISQARRERRGV